MLESELDTYNFLVLSLKTISVGFCPTGIIFLSIFIVPFITDTELESVLATYTIFVLLSFAIPIDIPEGWISVGISDKI